MSAAYAPARAAVCAHCGCRITRYGRSGNPLAFWEHDGGDARCYPAEPTATTWAVEARREWR